MRIQNIYLLFLTVFALSVLGFPNLLLAQQFVPLVTLPGITDFTNAASLVNGAVRLIIAAAALLAIIQIIRGGFVYLTTEAVSARGDALGLIRDALTGLLLILASVLILTIINPDILNVRFFRNEVGEQKASTPSSPPVPQEKPEFSNRPGSTK